MKKSFTLNLGSTEIDYVASNESLDEAKPIMVIDGKLSTNETGEDRLLHASVLLAVPNEVRSAVSHSHPVIYIYNAKDLSDGLNNQV